ncbi:unnamed protein product [Brassica rapa subsp. narinosa]
MPTKNENIPMNQQNIPPSQMGPETPPHPHPNQMVEEALSFWSLIGTKRTRCLFCYLSLLLMLVVKYLVGLVCIVVRNDTCGGRDSFMRRKRILVFVLIFCTHTIVVAVVR